MPRLVRLLGTYAAYHRDPRNVALHVAGVPLILLAVELFLSRPTIAGVTPAMIASALAALFYLRLDLRFGAVMAAVLALCVAIGSVVARQPTAVWLGGAGGLFVVGWAIQLVGHGYEGRKPAFLDDVIGLLIGPLFVVAEIGFRLGWRPELRAAIGRDAR